MPTTAEQILNEALSLPLEARADLTERLVARLVAHSDRKYLAVCEGRIALFQYSDSALGEIDLHDTATKKVDTQNPIDRLLTASAKRAEVDSQDRFWKSYTTACRLQIIYAISKALPIHALHCLPIG